MFKNLLTALPTRRKSSNTNITKRDKVKGILMIILVVIAALLLYFFVLKGNIHKH